MFQKVDSLYLYRDFRGPLVFAVNQGGVTAPWGHPDPYSLNANSWHRPPVPGIPVDATFVNVCGMFVGGVKPGHQPFMFHVDFRDPLTNPTMESALDWSEQGQGDFYLYYSSPNERSPFGGFWVPCAHQSLLLRWKIDTDYGSAYGINIWCQGYATSNEAVVATRTASRRKRRA